MIILRLLLLLTNLHLKLLSTQGTGADKLLSTQRVKNRLKSYGEQNGYAKNLGEPFMAHLKILYNIPWYWYLAAIYIELLYSIPCITEYNHTSNTPQRDKHRLTQRIERPSYRDRFKH